MDTVMEDTNDVYITLAVLCGIILLVTVVQLINNHCREKYGFAPITIPRVLLSSLVFIFIYISAFMKSASNNEFDYTAFAGLFFIIVFIGFLIYISLKTTFIIGLFSTIILMVCGAIGAFLFVFIIGYWIFQKMSKDFKVLA